MHSDPFAYTLLQLAVLLALALLGRFAAARLNQPPVLGELLVGVIAGNLLALFDGPLETVVHGSAVFAQLGVILLLFMVGLETDLRQMRSAGRRAMLVAVAGVVAPLLLGLCCGWLLLPGSDLSTDLFLGATLCATSVGITARVFKDLQLLKSPEARLILGAAVIDDVLALVVLGVVSGIAAHGQVDAGAVLKTLILSAAFTGVILWQGERVARAFLRELNFLDAGQARLLLPLILCFALSWLASETGLAAIVGAFAAGLILKDKDPGPEDGLSLRALVEPLEAVFAPVFFLWMGLQVDLTSFARPGVLALAIGLSLAGVVGKLACVPFAGKDVDGLSVGLGMVPRGEVGLIFASTGRALGVLNDATFSAVVIMVIVTTLCTPPALRWSLARRPRPS
jgi:Kef-type K+ transport system membrane component KefB